MKERSRIYRMDPGFLAYLLESGLSEFQIEELSPEVLISRHRDYEKSRQGTVLLTNVVLLLP